MVERGQLPGVVKIGRRVLIERARLVAQRISAKLEGTANTWYRSGTHAVHYVRPGQHCLLADGVDKTLELAVVTDTARDGRGYVVAYEPFSRNSERAATKSLRGKLMKLGLKPTSTAFRTRWLGPTTAGEVVEEIYGRRVRLRFDRELGV